MGDSSAEKEAGVVETDADNRYIRFADKLGQGAFKVVYRGIDRDQGLEVAWNQIKLDSAQVDFQKLIKEVKFLKQLSHPNIIVFHNSWVDREKLQVVIITECMTSGTLSKFIKRAGHVKLKVIKGWCVQVLEGLKYLHTQDPPVIHRDIKCDNIFINGTIGQVKIGDLGLATLLHDSAPLSVIGTPEFMAPELYEEEYDERVDIWSFGMCLLEMATGRYPYKECENAAQIFKRVSEGRMPRGYLRVKDVEVKEFLRLCLDKAETRLSSEELLEHPFLIIDEEKDNRSIELHTDEEVEELVNIRKRNREANQLRAKERKKRRLRTKRSNEKLQRRDFESTEPTGDASGQSSALSPSPELKPRRKLSDTSKVATGDKPEDQRGSPRRVVRNISARRDSMAERAKRAQAMKKQDTLAEPETETRERSQSDVSIMAAFDEDAGSVMLQFRILVQGEVNEVKFKFDLENDKPERVATEMVNSLNLQPSAESLETIASEICKKIEAATGSKLFACAKETTSDLEVRRTSEPDPRPGMKRGKSGNLSGASKVTRRVRVVDNSTKVKRSQSADRKTAAPVKTDPTNSKVRSLSNTEDTNAEEEQKIKKKFQEEKNKLMKQMEQLEEAEQKQIATLRQQSQSQQPQKVPASRRVTTKTRVVKSANSSAVTSPTPLATGSRPMKKSGTNSELYKTGVKRTLRKVNTSTAISATKPSSGKSNTSTSNDMTSLAEKFLEGFVENNKKAPAPNTPQPNLLVGPADPVSTTSPAAKHTAARSASIQHNKKVTGAPSPVAENPFHTLPAVKPKTPGAPVPEVISPPPGQVQQDLLSSDVLAQSADNEPSLTPYAQNEFGLFIKDPATEPSSDLDSSSASDNGPLSPIPVAGNSIPGATSSSYPNDGSAFMTDSMLFCAPKKDNVLPQWQQTAPTCALTGPLSLSHTDLPDPFSPLKPTTPSQPTVKQPSESTSLIDDHFNLSAPVDINSPLKPRMTIDLPLSGASPKDVYHRDNASRLIEEDTPRGQKQPMATSSPFASLTDIPRVALVSTPNGNDQKDTDGQLIKALTSPRIDTKQMDGHSVDRMSTPPPSLSNSQHDLLSPFDITFKTNDTNVHNTAPTSSSFNDPLQTLPTLSNGNDYNTTEYGV